jgi:hypothetical protein
MVAIGGIADIVQHWHEMARSRMTQSGQASGAKEGIGLLLGRIHASQEQPLGSSVASLIGRRVGSGLLDELGRFFRMRHVGHMAGIHFNRRGMGALCHHALLLRID